MKFMNSLIYLLFADYRGVTLLSFLFLVISVKALFFWSLAYLLGASLFYAYVNIRIKYFKGFKKNET